jgi:hypothetical protein
MDTPPSVPRAAMLDAWSEQEWNNGLQIDDLAELESLAVRTQNSIYEITVLDGRRGEVLVRGGDYFPERTPALLSGSTLGGTFLKRHGIYVGMKMEFVPQPTQMVSKVVYDPTTGQKEFLLGHRVITTSPVESIGIVL